MPFVINELRSRRHQFWTPIPLPKSAGISAGTASLTLTTHSATVNVDVEIEASTQALNVTTYPATVNVDVDVGTGTPASLSVNTHAATISVDVDVATSTPALTVTTYPATIDLNIQASTASLIVTTYPATIGKAVNTTTASLTLTTYPATIGVVSPGTVTGPPDAPFVLREQRSRQQKLAIPSPSYPETPPLEERIGYHPGSAGVETLRSSFTRQLQETPHPASYPVAAPPAAQPFAALMPARETRAWQPIAAHLQQVHLGVFTETPQSYYTGDYPSAFQALTANRTSFKRRHLTALMPEDFDVQPTTAAVPPAYFEPKQHRRHEQRKIVRLPQLDVRPWTVQSPAA